MGYGYGPLHPKGRLNGATMAVDESVAAPEKWEIAAARRERWEHVRFGAYVGLLLVLAISVFTVAAAVRDAADLQHKDAEAHLRAMIGGK